MRILLLCAATFVVGLLAGSMFLPEPGSDRSRAREEGIAGLRDGTSPWRAGEADTEGSPRTPNVPRGRNADVATLTSAAAREMERIMSSERAEAFLAGNGKISGTVRDPAGEPVAGVMVTALPEAQPMNISLARRHARQRPHADRDLADVAQEAIQAELWRRDVRRTAKTGQSGRYEITGLMDSRHTLTAFHEQYDVQPLSQRGRVQPDAVVDFQARPAIEVKVEVRMPDGALAEYAWLQWEGPHGRGRDTWTKERGTARLPVGNCKAKAQTWLPEPMESQELERVIDERNNETLVFQLEGRRVLTARLVLPEGFALPRTVEYRLRKVDREEVDPESLLKDQGQYRANTPSPGRAHWFDLEPGRYLAAAFLDKRRLIAHGIAEVGDAASEVDLQVEAPEAGSYLTVKLLGPDGGPVGQAQFHVIARVNNRDRWTRADALQRDGAWLVYLDGVDEKAENAAKLRVRTWGYGNAEHPIQLRGGGTITIRFDKPGELKVKLDDYSGSGVEGSLFAALRNEQGTAAWKQIAPDGTCELPGIQPGSYDFLLFVRRKDKNWSIYKRPMNVDTGEDELTMRVPPLHTLRVRWGGGGRPRNVVLRCNDERLGNFRRDARLSGKVATFEALAAGTYTVECARKRATVRVPGLPEVVLE